MEERRYEALKQVRDDVLNGKNLPLYSYRISNKYYPVIGQGNHYAKLVTIAEAPVEEEILAYSTFLIRQLEVIKPEIIVTLGRVAMEWMVNEYKLGNFGKISQIHGQIFKLKIGNRLIEYIPMFHPAMALYDQNKLIDMEKDIRELAEI